VGGFGDAVGKRSSALFFATSILAAPASLSALGSLHIISITAASAKDNSDRGNSRRLGSNPGSNQGQGSSGNSGINQGSNQNQGSSGSDRASRAGNDPPQLGRKTATGDTAPPDNLVDFIKWLAQPAAPTAPPTSSRPRPGAPSDVLPTTGRGWTTVVKPVAAKPSTKHDTRVPVRKVAGPAEDRKAEAPAAGSGPHSGAIKTAGGRLIRPGSIHGAPGTYRTTELLAVNLDKAALDAVGKHFVSPGETIALPNLTVTVLKSEGPEDITSVFKRLSGQMPSTDFALNYVYRPVGAERTGNNSVVSEGVDSTKGCTPQQCYGRTMVGWQPQLDACASGVNVGVIDTGYDKRHPAFVGRVFREPTSAQLPLSGPPTAVGHGTGVLSLLAGNPNSALPGLIPSAQFSVANAFFDDGHGHPMTDTLTVLRALNFMREGNVKIVNMSMAGPEDPLLHLVIQKMAAAGILIVAAAGNEGPDAPPSYPAAYPEVIAVTAVDYKLKNYIYANRGAHIDVAAPGVDIWTALPGARQGSQTGTSFAAPFVTAIIAASYPAAEWRRGIPAKPKSVLLERLSTKDLGDKHIFGRGLLQAPTTCRPGEPPALAEGYSTPTAERTWPATLQRVSLPQQN
jgi:Subtilase family